MTLFGYLTVLVSSGVLTEKPSPTGTVPPLRSVLSSLWAEMVSMPAALSSLIARASDDASSVESVANLSASLTRPFPLAASESSLRSFSRSFGSRSNVLSNP